MKKIKSFEGVGSISFMCNLHPKKKNFREWEFQIDGVETEDSILFYESFKNGGKKIQRDLFDFLEMFYHLKILPKKKGLTMYHGTREILWLHIINGVPSLHHRNIIYSSFDYCRDFEKSGSYEIKGTYQFNYNTRVWNFKKVLLNIFNKYL